ncbi:hypothetical protein [Mucilaginibacter lacusdianchii]|uniref:hypothetical protein n=1 Tax=Mucilaginibacter lacusdianchii TaxID=2684211 RepID=UPI00131D5125|nr:hypothetical protein [Mucilaginibacter sp. JXJ CY 39]
MKKAAVLLLLVAFFASCKKDESTTPSTDNTDLAPSTAVLQTVAQQMPSVLPKHVAFGTEGDITYANNFIKESDYQYQYLAGDIFSSGWTTWNLPYGSFVTNYLNKVGSMGKIPVFTYYNIVPAKNRFEDPGFTNLHDAEVMNAYFNDFKLVLQLCKKYNKPVIIHYEPDLMGYMEMFKKDATKTAVKVSDSGNSEAQGFSNDAKGLFQTIVNMRNKYAPNVLLGWHASQWATGYDVIKDKHNPEQIASETVTYYKSLNAKFDLIFSEFSDRDAWYDKLVRGKANAEWSTQPTAANGNLSDYDRFQRFLATLNRTTGQKIILWQIPIGNHQTKTCNNTLGHYQDNKAEYFLQQVLDNGSQEKIKQYGQAGVIAFLFGKGHADCTSFMDTRKDGITGANETADDDGGYLRKGIKAYYQKGAVAVQ